MKAHAKMSIRDSNNLQKLYDSFVPALDDELLAVIQYDLFETDLANTK